jgi:sec-independent protein translocase protein TatA
MGGVSIWHWAVVGLIAIVLFGRGKISGLMGDLALGIKAFKQGVADDTPTVVQPPAALSTIPPQADAESNNAVLRRDAD